VLQDNTSKRKESEMALSQLKFSTIKKPTMITPVVHRRFKLVKRVDEQIGLATAQAEGTLYSASKQRSVIDSETGLRRVVDVPKSVKAWYFTAETGKVYLNIKYGSRVIEITKGKPTIEVGSAKELVPTLKLIRQAILDGELDTQIDAASGDLRKGFKQD
jgi:hypothetical protein